MDINKARRIANTTYEGWSRAELSEAWHVLNAEKSVFPESDDLLASNIWDFFAKEALNETFKEE